MTRKETTQRELLSRMLVSMAEYLEEVQNGHPIQDPNYWAQELLLDNESEIEEIELTEEQLLEFEQSEFPRVLKKIKLPASKLSMERVYSLLKKLPSDQRVLLASVSNTPTTVAEILTGLEYRGNNDTRMDNLPSAYSLSTFRLGKESVLDSNP